VTAGVAWTVLACEDTSAYAAGQGIERLRAGGVAVTSGFLADEAAFLYADYRPATDRPRTT
jgi:pyrimidine deaminase RibD-like protein